MHGDLSAKREKCVNVERGGDPHAVEHVSQILGHNVTARPRCMRASAEAADAGVELSDPHLKRYQAVRKPKPARVMEVHRVQPVAGYLHRRLEEFGNAHRVGMPYCVCKTNALDTDIERALDEAYDLAWVDESLDRATKGRADADLQASACASRVARSPDTPEFGDHLVGCLAHIGEAVRVTRRQREHHSIRLLDYRAFGTTQVGDEHLRSQTRQSLRERQDLGRIGQLRH